MIGELCDRSLAAPGFVSYRARSRYGWIMIGARSDQDALNEAKRSNSKARHCDLQVWNGDRYVELHSLERNASPPKCQQPIRAGAAADHNAKEQL